MTCFSGVSENYFCGLNHTNVNRTKRTFADSVGRVAACDGYHKKARRVELTLSVAYVIILL